MVDQNYRSSADAIRNLARLFKHMEAAADALESVANLDQANGEKQRILAELDGQIAARKADIVTQFGEIERAKEDAALVTQRAKNKAEAMYASAKQGADSIAAVAHAAAAKVKEDARISADGVLANVNAQAATLLGKADALRIQSDALAIKVTEQEIELKRVTDAITAARATMAQIMGNAQ